MAGATRAAGSGALVERLEARRDEIEQTLLTRVYAVSDPAEVGDPEYALGLKTAVTVALNYALACLGSSEAHRPPLPPELPAQAKAAARAGVSLDTVLRRYFAGYTLLTDCLVREAQGGTADLLAAAMRAQVEQFDRLVTAVAAAYVAEAQSRLRNADYRRGETVKRLLEGDLVDPTRLGYELEAWHLGIIAAGPRAPAALRELAAGLDRRLLLIPSGGEVIWAWLGGRCKVEDDEISPLLSARTASTVPMAVGEAGAGVTGWRLTHQQARAAFPAARGTQHTVVYSDIALVASVWGNDSLVRTLTQRFLMPIMEAPDGGTALRETLRTYLGTGRNAASTAATLGVSRQTVNNRLRDLEKRVGVSLDRCGLELETALRLRDLGHPAALCHTST